MSYRIFFFLVCFYVLPLPAQQTGWCDSLEHELNNIEEKTNSISISDPELISLHYLFVLDLETELQHFYNQRITQWSRCDQIDFNKLINKYDRLRDQVRFLKDTLYILKDYVDQMFFDNAFLELQLKNYPQALYNINRSLEYKPFAVNALLLKLDILFEKKDYEKCLEVLNILYHEVSLDHQQEKRTAEVKQSL